MQEKTSTIPWWVWDCIKDERTETFGITGGLGSGKSFGSAIWFLERCIQNSRSKFSWAVAPTHSKVRDILIPTFQEVLFTHFGLMHGKHYETFITKPPKTIFFKSGHEIHYHSGARPDLMVGTNISHYLITEAGMQSLDVYERCQARTRCPKARLRQGLLEGTPEGINYYSDLFDVPEGYNADTRRTRYKLHTRDNDHLPTDYVDKLTRTYGYDPAKLQSYLFGDFVPFTRGTAYWEFFHSRNVVLDVAASKQLPLLLCWDFNLSPLAWGAVQRQTHETRSGYRFHRYVQLAESSGSARGIMDACVEFMTQFPPDEWADVPVHIYGDCSGYAGHVSSAASNCYDQIYQYLKQKYRNVQIYADRKAPSIQSRLERVNALLANEEFVIAAWCRNSIKGRTNTSLKKGMWKIEKPTGEDWTHFAEAVDYMLFQETKDLDLTRYTQPKIFGMNL